MLDVQLLMLPCRHSLRLGDVDLVRLPMPNRSKPKQVGRQGGRPGLSDDRLRSPHSGQGSCGE